MSALRAYGRVNGTGPAKSWVFTVNNWTQAQWDALVKLGDDEDCSYLVMGREIAPTTQTPHIQGCVTFRTPKRRRAVVRLIPASWTEPAGHLKGAREYCLKEDENAFLVDNTRQGTRSDLSTAVATLKESGLQGVVDNHPETYVRFHNGLASLAQRLQTPRDPAHPPEVWWIYGHTGCNKTRFVHEREPDLWVSLDSNRWWEGYTQQAAILIDDMRGAFARFEIFLKIIDRYPLTQERKNGAVQVNSARIYITSQHPPSGVYTSCLTKGENIEQLYRRITKLVRVTRDISELSPGTDVELVHGVFHETLSDAQIARQISDAAATSFTPAPDIYSSWRQS